MIVSHHMDEILVEYQIKVKDLKERSEIAEQRNKFNHLLYEFERADALTDLINAINF